MKHPWFILLVATSSLLRAETATVGRIGDLELKSDEVRESIAGLEAGRDSVLSKDPAALGQYVRALLVQRLVLKEALARGWDREPAVAARLVRAREAAITESFLAEASKVPDGFPSEEELANAYEQAKPKLQVPKSYRLAQIFIALPEDADRAAMDKARQRLDGVVAKLKEKNADFAAIAAAESDETASRAKGGEIGWVAENQIRPEFRATLRETDVGAVSAPLKLDDGWHVLKVLESKEAHVAPFGEVREQLATQLRAERASLKRQEYLAALLKDHPLAVNELELARLLEK